MRKGIDISVYQTKVDYSKLKEQGIEFAIIRCGFGRMHFQKDAKFEEHYKGLKEVGIKVGCYLYSYADNINDGKNEAYNCLELIKDKNFEIGVFYDLEDKVTTKNLNKSQITQIAKDFCTIIEKEGYKAGIYANLNWFNNFINVKELENYYIWLAQWSESHTANFKVDFWQYSSEGKILGIPNNVDLNYDLRKENIYENTDSIKENKKSNEEIANEVIEGLWGNGELRKVNLSQAGYNYVDIQKIVNEKLASVGTLYHTVKKGENLTKIAQIYGTTVSTLVALNKIKNPNLIYVNQRLRIR
jgi:GH25 family lysozyme M1 (1,4-beta-N-acetylmuramidase)